MLSSLPMPQSKIAVSHERTKSDLTVSITERPAGRDFEFILKGNHLRAVAMRKRRGSDEADWYKSLDDVEKVRVMNTVLASYRLPSLHRDKWKVSAVGIVENPEPDADSEKKHLTFVGVNTDMRAETLDKSCAEQEMLSGMVTNISHYQYHKRGNEMAKPPVPKEIHMMGGREADPNKPDDKGEKIIAPCGKCTDTLAQWMDPKSFVYIYPANTGSMPLKINETATSLDEVKGNEVWKTTIGHLNRNRHINLTNEQAQQQRDGFEMLVKELLQPPPPVPDDVIERAMHNKRGDIDSVPELDVATANGSLDPKAANAYLHNLVVKALRTRMKREFKEPTEDDVRQWLTSGKIDDISATIVQYDDGTYTHGLKAQTTYDGAAASSQLSGVTNTEAVIKSGDNHATRVWSMNFSPEDIAKGMTTTPSKEGVERVLKRMNGSGIERPFMHFAFNDSSLSNPSLIAFAFSNKDLYPGGFKGNSWKARAAAQDEHACGHAH